MAASQDPTAQAKAFIKLVGKLEPGELPICDLEVGSGNQAARWRAWASVIKDAYGISPWLYSGSYFAKTEDLAPQWVAAYQSVPPSMPHLMWQFSESYHVPGVGIADCSVFSGSLSQLTAHAYGGKKPQPTPSPQNWTEAMISELPTLAQGDKDSAGHVFYVHRMQALVGVVGQINNLPAAASLAADGNFGPSTKAALDAVQKFFGITGANSQCGPRTWAALVTGSAS
jgi:hypothetical protein